MTLRAAGLLALAVTSAVVVTLLGLATNQASSQERWPGPLDVLRAHPWVAGALLTLVGALLSLLLQRLTGRWTPTGPPIPVAPPVPEWVVARSESLDVVKALCRRTRGTIGITTALRGAGGFGKTTLAEVACADPKVRRRFRGRIFVVTIGREVRGREALAAKVAEVTRFVTGDTTTFDDPGLAGAHLGRLLDEQPRTLLVLDDIWEREQLEPFLHGGRDVVRLVTTRVPKALPGDAHQVRVDAMSDDQARAALTWGLPELPRATTELILAVTGGWPLLLRLANRLIAADLETGSDPADATRDVLERLRAHGPVGVDPTIPLDVDDPKERRKAVRATVEAATRLLTPEDTRRFVELCVFAEDESIPVALVVRLWHGERDGSRARELIRTLANLSLLTLHSEGGGFISLHDVVRDYLQRQLTDRQLSLVHGKLTRAMALGLAPAEPLVADDPSPETSWWETPYGYTLDHLIAHLIAADRSEPARTVAQDLRWIERRLYQRGPVAPYSDLAQLGTHEAAQRVRELSRVAHLLTPTTPEHALKHVLYSRLGHRSAWRGQVAALVRDRTGPGLAQRWEPPDLIDGLLRSSLVHPGPVTALAVAPDDAWLVGGCADGSLHVWETRTWSRLATVRAHTDRVAAVSVASDGSWLVTGSADGTAKKWETATWTCAGTFSGHDRAVTALALSPDDSVLVTGSADRTLRTWNPDDGSCTAKLKHHAWPIRGIAFQPDGSHFFSTCDDQVVRWVTGTSRRSTPVSTDDAGVGPVAVARDRGVVLSTSRGLHLVRRPTHRAVPALNTVDARLIVDAGPVTALAVSDDGDLIAIAGPTGATQIHPLGSGSPLVATGHLGAVNDVAFAHSGSWFMTAGSDGTVRTWDLRGERPHTVPSQGGRIAFSRSALSASVSAGGEHLAVISTVGKLTVRRPPTEPGPGRARVLPLYDRNAPFRHGYEPFAALSPDGALIAVCEEGTWTTPGNGTAHIRLLDTSGRRLHRYQWYEATITAVAVTPDRTIAAGTADGRVMFWAPGAPEDTSSAVPGHRGKVTTAASAPDGGWIVTGGADAQIKVWDVTSRQPRAIARHPAAVTSTAIAADGSWLAAGDLHGTVHVLDMARGTITDTFRTASGSVKSIAISPDGVWISVVSSPRTIEVWHRATCRRATMMRTEAPLLTCSWTGGGDDLGLVACSTRGLHGFAFLPPPTP
ncbi:NB-ARC domain-containing protein [Streptomyces virginiae]|uniref:NB-ARC domain-containing protein n=1 Tax=Streptomyces virginiae TaxID=1961 RepID=UPI00224FE76C|nr:NB-ARC domain-containing protein [Streptomyces virginiae]MCX5174071.1 NB-ARC domain-containing protein [Streptomyces virginiae]